MNPMTMKQPAPCCGSPTLLWMPEKGYYACPCGKLKVNLDGQIIKARGVSKPGHHYGRPRKYPEAL